MHINYYNSANFFSIMLSFYLVLSLLLLFFLLYRYHLRYFLFPQVPNIENVLMNSKLNQLRISIVAASGSGKSYSSRKLSSLLNIPHLELDTIHWLENWKEREKTETRNMIQTFINENKQYIIDGNQFFVQIVPTLPPSSITTVIWLNYPIPVTLIQVIMRSLFRAFKAEVLWNKAGTIETFEKLLSSDSIIKYSFISRRKLLNKFSLPQTAEFLRQNNIELLVFHHPNEMNLFLTQIQSKLLSQTEKD